ncbi:Zinc finger, C2H2-like protein [Moelleriella libera RCEF 2490]|uniref:Zinc finger, C2H2-like protein n=1 Tax=Moelleriella libera RCEF 2490 TaxID=1081109 RepID=A0A166N1Y3_9HYPO|nr:Zinc finger, C2H2-like protein [Moelleriella libera RCEF 2490]
MDQSQNHQLQQPLSLQSTASSPSADASPQDVLSEARKNLQYMIDAGISRETLHQWVDDSLSLQQLPSRTSTLASSSSCSSSSPSQQSSLAPQHAPPPPPPPPPQCPPPPPPSGGINSDFSLSPATVTSSSGSSTVASSGDVKAEAFADDMSGNWPVTPAAFGPPSANAVMTGMDQPSAPTMSSVDASMFLPPSAAFAHHRPRISISSVSSGSSGHASIWSTNSAQSTFSYQSAASARSMAPLPMIPSGPQNVPVINGTHVGSAASSANRQNIYWCTSCETSFKRKYDWKRHEDEFHERWRKYPCPEPGCNRSFWGSNSFNQHHKQCHGCKTCPHAEKVVKYLRKRKYWACGFCSALHPARERHVEHVARHFESGLTKAEWMHSRVIYGLLHQPLVHEAWENLVNSKQPDFPSRRPQFSWHPNKTGRAQGFLEHEAPGQLQDHLEFFLGQENEAHDVAKMAYELADIIMTPAPAPSPQFVNSSGSMGPPPPQHPPFATLASQAHPQGSMLSPTSPNTQNAFGSSFRAPVFVPSQPFGGPTGPSPDSSSHSPLTASHSPLGGASSPMEKLDVQHSTSSSANSITDTMMDYDLSSNEAAFRDWPNLMGGMTTNAEPQQASNNTDAEWSQSMFQYSYDPRVTSA